LTINNQQSTVNIEEGRSFEMGIKTPTQNWLLVEVGVLNPHKEADRSTTK
jgi:hypothetical protein